MCRCSAAWQCCKISCDRVHSNFSVRCGPSLIKLVGGATASGQLLLRWLHIMSGLTVIRHQLNSDCHRGHHLQQELRQTSGCTDTQGCACGSRCSQDIQTQELHSDRMHVPFLSDNSSQVGLLNFPHSAGLLQELHDHRDALPQRPQRWGPVPSQPPVRRAADAGPCAAMLHPGVSALSHPHPPQR